MPSETQQKPSTARLSDFIIEEVSMVDKAANRRRFLAVKRDPMALGAEIVAGPDGSFTTRKDGPPPAAATPAPTPAPTPPVVAPQAKATLSLTEGAKQSLTQAIADVTKMLADASAMVEGANVVETEEEMATVDLTDLLVGASETLDDVAYSLVGEDAPPEEGALEGEGPAPVTAAAPSSEYDFSKRLMVAKAKRVIEKAEAMRIRRSYLEKVGARMKKERLYRFENAIRLLSSVLSEVRPGLDKARKLPPDPKAKPGVPAVQKGLWSDPQIKIRALETQVKKQAEEIAAMRGGGASSNAIQAEGLASSNLDSKEYVWPRDMNEEFESSTEEALAR